MVTSELLCWLIGWPFSYSVEKKKPFLVRSVLVLDLMGTLLLEFVGVYELKKGPPPKKIEN